MRLLGCKRFRCRRWALHGARPSFGYHGNGPTLADAPLGRPIRVRGFSPSLPAERRAHLQAYGLLPGHWAQVVQHTPVTVIQIEHTELALEGNLARLIEVEE